jgi:hypothetical protein
MVYDVTMKTTTYPTKPSSSRFYDNDATDAELELYAEEQSIYFKAIMRRATWVPSGPQEVLLEIVPENPAPLFC